MSIDNGALQTTQYDPWTEPLDLEQSLETHSSLGLNEAGSLIKGWKVYLNNGCHDHRIVASTWFLSSSWGSALFRSRINPQAICVVTSYSAVRELPKVSVPFGFVCEQVGETGFSAQYMEDPRSKEQIQEKAQD